MKCVIQIPCYNEETSLPITLAELPRSLPGFDRVEWLVVDDGSTDRTAQVARQHGVDHIIRLTRHVGLGAAFMGGLDACLACGADVIVNTDADNQYRGADIAVLVQPIIAGTADVVVGTRPINDIPHFSFSKKLMQRMGSAVVRIVSGTRVVDAVSGFRAYSRRAALGTTVFNEYTYTLETLIQAGRNGLAVVSVPIRTNPMLRPSRLIRGTMSYLLISAVTLVRTLVVYYPFRFFASFGTVFFGAGLLVGLRFLYLFAAGRGQGHVQSLILSAILIVVGSLLFVLAVVSDLMAVNRMILERIRAHQHGSSSTRAINDRA
jgi:glycosyltransferase involved in cell wall biosynthesis